jgi:hypothetical protein
LEKQVKAARKKRERVDLDAVNLLESSDAALKVIASSFTSCLQT